LKRSKIDSDELSLKQNLSFTVRKAGGFQRGIKTSKGKKGAKRGAFY